MARKQVFVDTNIFLRFLTRDDVDKAEACRMLLEQAERGEVNLVISHLVLAELAWTLESYYRLSRQEIAENLRELLNLRSIRVSQKALLLRAVQLYEQFNVDFTDAYNVAEMEKRSIRHIYSYDEDFDKLGVERIAP